MRRAPTTGRPIVGYCILLYQHNDIRRCKTIDARQYWQGVLQRVIAVIKFLGERGLAFRGNDDMLQSQHNGNYSGILELIS